jgi:hypothetical protein
MIGVFLFYFKTSASKRHFTRTRKMATWGNVFPESNTNQKKHHYFNHLTIKIHILMIIINPQKPVCDNYPFIWFNPVTTVAYPFTTLLPGYDRGLLTVNRYKEMVELFTTEDQPMTFDRTMTIPTQLIKRFVRNSGYSLVLASMAGIPAAVASPSISGGIWFNYTYDKDSNANKEEMGAVDYESLILYFNDAPEDKPYFFNGELRLGKGAFTAPDSNNTGGHFGIHQAEIGFKASETATILVGKTAVPFGKMTVNFWPGDMLIGGYGDQMDIGVKFTNSTGPLAYQIGYFHADDWGEYSTETMDDGGHWGHYSASDATASTYRKVQTLVADATYSLAEDQKIGVSAQSGSLFDLTTQEVDGDHSAFALYYQGSFSGVSVTGELMKASRTLPDSMGGSSNDSDRALLTLGYSVGDINFYMDSTWARSDDVSTVHAYAPGMSYKYGPGWLYVEYLTQNGDIGADNNVVEGNYDALYLTVDYYF